MKMRSRLAMALVLTALPHMAAAQDISWKLPQMKRGDYVATVTKYRNVEHKDGVGYTIYAGKKGRNYVTQTFSGSGADAELLITSYRDKNGNTVRAVYPDGFEYRYHPHDCGRTLGRCSYSIAMSDGRKFERVAVTRVENGRVFRDEYDADGQRSIRTWWDMDSLGTPLKSETVGANGKRRSVVSAKAHYK